MEQILKDFLDNNEANDAYVTSKVTYISIEDVQTLLNRQKQQLRLHVVGSRRELLIAYDEWQYENVDLDCLDTKEAVELFLKSN